MKYYTIDNVITGERFQYPADKITIAEFWAMISRHNDPKELVWKGVVEE